MAEPIAVAFVEIRPEASSFRAETEGQVKQALAGTDQVAASLSKIGTVNLTGTLAPVVAGAKTAVTEVEALTAAVTAVPAALPLAVGLADAGKQIAAVTVEAAALGEGTSASAAGLASVAAESGAATTGLKSVSAEFTDLIARNRAAQAQSESFLVTSRQQTAAALEQAGALKANAGAQGELTAAREAGAGAARIPIAGSILGIAALFAGVQALGQLSAALKVSGNEASSWSGKLRNAGSAILSGDVIGVFKALTHSSHDFSLEELVLIERSPKVASALKEIGLGADVAKSQLKALQGLTQVPAQAQARVAEAQFSGSSADQISALREEGQRLKEQTDQARLVGTGSAGLSAALADLFKQRTTIRNQIQSLIGKQQEGVLSGLAESVTDAQLSGDVSKITQALLNEKAALLGVLIPFAASADIRRKFKEELLSVNKEIESIQADLIAEEKRHHDEMISSFSQFGDELILTLELAGDSDLAQKALEAALRGRANLLKLLLAVETDRDTRIALLQQLQAVNGQIESIEQQRAQTAKDHAAKVKTAAADAHQSLLDSLGLREQGLENQEALAALSGSVSKQREILQKQIALFKEEAANTELTLSERRTAVAKQIAAEAELKQLNRQATRDRIANLEQTLQDNVTLASFTEKTTVDDANALRRLIAFEKKQAHNQALSVAERRAHLIAQKRAEQDLANLTKQAKTDGASFQKQSFEFLKTQHGFASTIASNLLPPTPNVAVGGGFAPRSSPFATPATTSPVEDLRASGGQGVSRGQGETLITLGRRQLAALQRLNAGVAHPEAAQTRRSQGAVMETTAHA